MNYLPQGRIYSLNKENIAKVSNSPGLYSFYNKNRSHIYVGRTEGKIGAKWGTEPHQRFKYGLKHRLQSYVQKDDRREHPTKPALRKEARYFSYRVVRSPTKRRELEKKLKSGLKHNHL